MFIVHFGAPELYPPVMNAVNYFATVSGEQKIVLLTTTSPDSVQEYMPAADNISVLRLGKIGFHSSSPRKWFTYCWFNGISALLLLFYRPRKVLYYESISSFAPVFYKRFVRPSAGLFIHYHEYMTPGEYAHGMRLVNWYHKMEKKVYPFSAWISHTNEYRMELFAQDNTGITIPNKQTIPNYPPAAWMAGSDRNKKIFRDVPVRIVYIGALSLETMHLASFAQWVERQAGRVTWDIYSLNMSRETREYLAGLNSAFINIKPGVYYSGLPAILGNYDVGVILYKGYSPNWIYNAPNKLFEYHVCGLDVWLPAEMVGSLPLVTDRTFPRIIAIDFDNPGTLAELTDRRELSFKQFEFTCEQALYPLAQQLLAENNKG